MARKNKLPDVEDLWDDEEEKKSFKKVMFPFLIAGFLKGVGNVLTEGDPEDLLTGKKRKEFDSKSLDYAAKTVGTTKEALKQEIDEAVKNGESVKQLAGRIDDLYGDTMGYRSLRIARTQLTEAVNEGTFDALEEEGHGEKEWSTVIDGSERESHHDADGQVVPIDQPFELAGGEGMYPGDPSLPISETAQCRCTIVSPRDSDRMKRVRGRVFLRSHGALERRYVVALKRSFRAQRKRVLSKLSRPPS